MRFKINRTRLRNSVLFGAPLALSIQCDSPDDEPTTVNELVVEIDPGAPFTEALNACLADRDACVALCDQILVEYGYTGAPGEVPILECNVTKQPMSVEVEIVYEGYPVAVGCGVVTVNPSTQPTSIGSHYAALAELEASSVYAFVGLARDLRRHGAPAGLVEAALRAAQDEARHAHLAAVLARAWSGTPRPVQRGVQPDRDLPALCVDNAVDGCVHETFGAAIAAHQAAHATDPFIRSIMASIAGDEQRHAALAAAIDRWARPRLSDSHRRALEAAARDAAYRLATSQKDAPGAVAELAGFPSATQARALARRLERRRRARWI